MLPYLIIMSVGVGVAALVVGVTMLVRGNKDDSLEDRLEALAGLNRKSPALLDAERSLLSGPLNDVPGQLERWISRVTNVRLWIEQADVSITPSTFLLTCLGLAGAGVAVGYVLGLKWYFYPPIGLTLAVLPFLLAVVCPQSEDQCLRQAIAGSHGTAGPRLASWPLHAGRLSAD